MARTGRHGGQLRVLSLCALLSCGLVGLFSSPSSAAEVFAVGATDGRLSVNPDGSAGYAIPIVVPPSPHGLPPTLTLSYASNTGNGIAGVGWSVGGLSRIERCSSSLELDPLSSPGIHFDASDKLCMDGERLVVKGSYGGGTEYRTERESGSRIVAYGASGPNPATYFKVWTKDGRYLVYGNSGGRYDAQVETNAPPSALRFWPLAHAENAGGSMDVHYINDNANGDHLPEHIWYSGKNATQGNSVHFLYETGRPDPIDGYVAGTHVLMQRRLIEIQAYSPGIAYQQPLSGQPARSYTLSYVQSYANGRSLLKSVQECGGGECLYPTVFTYGEESTWDPGFQRTNLRGNVFPQYYDNLDESGQSLRQADVNGDGHADYIFGPYGDGDSSLHWSVAFGGGSGPTPTLSDDVELTSLRGWRYGATTTDYDGVLTVSSYKKNVRLADVTGDGLEDLVGGPDTNGVWEVAKGNGSGFDAPVVWAISGDNGVHGVGFKNWYPDYPGRFRVADVDGDGRDDILCGPDGSGHWWVLRSTGSGFEQKDWLTNDSFESVKECTRIMDVNGDGRADVVWGPKGDGTWPVLLSTGSSGVKYANWIEGGGTAYPNWSGDDSAGMKLCLDIRPADVNGDGLQDLVLGPSTAGSWYVLLSTGKGFSDKGDYVHVPGGAHGGWHNRPERIYPADVNGDGRTDFVLGPGSSSADWFVLESRGTEFVSTGMWAQDQFSGWDARGSQRIRPIDWTGDGLTDIALGPSDNGADWYALTPKRSFPDLLVSVENALGARESIAYKPLAQDWGVYEKEHGASYPVRDLQGPLHVVSERSSQTGTGGTRTFQYDYKGLKSHVTGQRSLGFHEITVTDVEMNTVTTTTYTQEPRQIAGTTEQVKVLAPDGLTLTERHETWSWVVTEGVSYQPYLQSSWDKAYELHQTAPYNRVDFSSDPPGSEGCGYATTTKVLTGGHSLVTTPTVLGGYQSVDYRCIPSTALRVTARSTAPNAEEVTRTTDTLFNGFGQILQEVIEPNGANDVKLTTTYTYNPSGTAVGLLSQTTLSGADITSRVSIINAYDAFGFPTKKTDAEGHVTEMAYSPAHGGLAWVKVKKLDGVTDLTTTTWAYDGFGRQILEVRPDGTQTETWLDWVTEPLDAYTPPAAAYRVHTQVSGGGTTLSEAISYLDDHGRLLRRQETGFNGTLVFADKAYDSWGRLEAESKPYFLGDAPWWTEYTFDELWRVSTADPPGPEFVRTVYSGFSTSVTNAKGQTTTRTVDSQGKLASVTDATNRTTTYTYGPFGVLRFVTDPLSHTTETAYDLRGRRTDLHDPDAGNWHYTYFSTGELKTQTDGKNQVTTLGYDRLGRTKTRSVASGPTTTWTYDTAEGAGVGKLHTITSSDGAFADEYAYYDSGLVKSHKKTVNGTAYTVQTAYDGLSRPSTITYPSNFVVRRNYNDQGYLWKVDDPSGVNGTYWTANYDDSNFERFEDALGDDLGGRHSLKRVQDYYPDTRYLQALRTGLASGPGTELQNLGYSYDSSGNMTGRSDYRPRAGYPTGVSESFTYDELNRLTSATGPYGRHDYYYDALGNITNKTGVGTYTYDTQRPHQVTSVAGTLNGTMSYDANGSQIQRTGDLAKFQITANTPDEVVYVDGIYEKVTTGTLVEQKHYISGASGMVAIYTIPSVGQATLVYVTSDHLGSIDALASSAGVETNRVSFDAFGQRRSTIDWTLVDPTSVSSLTTKGFTGHDEEDNVALVHMGARLYDPVLGRFVSPDTFVDGVDAQGLNRYAYVGNNPLGYTDPTGHFKLKDLFSGISISFFYGVGFEIGINWNTGEFHAGVGVGVGGNIGTGSSSLSARASVTYGYDSEANQTYVHASGGIGPVGADVYAYTRTGDTVASIGVGAGTAGSDGGFGLNVGVGVSTQGGVSFSAGVGYASGSSQKGYSATGGIGVSFTPSTGSWSGGASASYYGDPSSPYLEGRESQDGSVRVAKFNNGGRRAIFSMKEGDPNLEIAEAAVPGAGELLLIGHGNEKAQTLGGRTADGVARIVRQNNLLEEGMQVRVDSCNLGKYPDGFAQQLSDALGASVTASPTRTFRLGPFYSVNAFWDKDRAIPLIYAGWRTFTPRTE